MSTTSSKNFTTLYSGSGSVTPQAPYGNANVVGLLAAGSDGANTVGNIDANGTITAAAVSVSGNVSAAIVNATTLNGNLVGGTVAASTISATGNVVTDGYFVGNFAGNITGNIAVTGSNTQVLFNNAGNVGASAEFTFNDATNVLSVTGNVAANYFIGNGSQLTGIQSTLPSATTNQYLRYDGSAWAAATLDLANDPSPSLGGDLGAGNFNIANAANIQANGTFIGSGGGLSNINGANVNGTVSSANVAGTVLGNAQGNITSVGVLTALSVAGNVTSGNVTTAGNVSANYFLGNGALLTGIAASYGNANVAAYLPTYTGAMPAMTGNVTTTANITGGNIATTGIVYTPQVEAVADLDLNVAGRVNINGNIRVGDNNANTEIATHGTGDLILRTNQGAANQGSITIFDGANGNIALAPNGTGVVTAGTISATGNITTTANVQGAYLIGDGSFITNLPGGSYGNANVAAYLPTYTGNLGNSGAGTLFVGSATGPSRLILGSGDWYLTGTSDALISSGQTEITLGTGDSANGNIKLTTQKTGNAFIWDFDGSGNLTLPPNVATPVIQAGNAVLRMDNASGNITAGNIVVNANQINTVAQQSVVIPTTAISNARIVIGNGWQGNISTAFDGPIGGRIRNARAAVWDYGTTGNSATQTELAVFSSLEITSNIANINSRINASSVVLQMGGGSAGNVVTTNNQSVTVAAQNTFAIGTSGNAAVGNTTIAQAIATGSAVTINAGSTATNAVPHQAAIFNLGGNVGNAVLYSAAAGRISGTAVATNTAVYYVPPFVGNSLVGGSIGAGFRTGTTYYGLRVDDDLAQAKLGSLRQYHEFEYQIPTTSGNVVIDKNNGQVQVLTPTGNITITDYTNFVSTAYVDGVVAEPFQADTVTIIVNQGTTGGFNITLPTSNVTNGQTFYANGIKTVSSTANSVTLISVTRSRLYAAGTQPAGRSDSAYLTTVSPAFTVA